MTSDCCGLGCENCRELPLSRGADLVPPRALEAVGRVLAFGDSKHPGDEWQRVPVRHHLEAAYRHIERRGALDHESGEPHLAHAIVRLMFLLELERDGGR